MPGLVGYWKLNDGGTHVRDSTPNGNDGALVGCRYNSAFTPPPIIRSLTSFTVLVTDVVGVTINGGWRGPVTLNGIQYRTDQGRNKGPLSIAFDVDVPVPTAYTVYIMYNVAPNAAQAVPVTVVHRSGYSTAFINMTQSSSVDGWVQVRMKYNVERKVHSMRRKCHGVGGT